MFNDILAEGMGRATLNVNWIGHDAIPIPHAFHHRVAIDNEAP